MSMLHDFTTSPVLGAPTWVQPRNGPPNPSALPQGRDTNARVLRRAIAFIDANLGERFSLEALAASAGVSRFHFARLFRAAIGYSPMEYLMRARVERSTTMLAHGEYSICEIAALLGFCDQSHFTRTFRRIIGITPREFMKHSSDGDRAPSDSLRIPLSTAAVQSIRARAF